jgi:hypothetical protein
LRKGSAGASRKENCHQDHGQFWTLAAAPAAAAVLHKDRSFGLGSFLKKLKTKVEGEFGPKLAFHQPSIRLWA